MCASKNIATHALHICINGLFDLKPVAPTTDSHKQTGLLCRRRGRHPPAVQPLPPRRSAATGLGLPANAVLSGAWSGRSKAAIASKGVKEQRLLQHPRLCEKQKEQKNGGADSSPKARHAHVTSAALLQSGSACMGRWLGWHRLCTCMRELNMWWRYASSSLRGVLAEWDSGFAADSLVACPTGANAGDRRAPAAWGSAAAAPTRGAGTAAATGLLIPLPIELPIAPCCKASGT